MKPETIATSESLSRLQKNAGTYLGGNVQLRQRREADTFDVLFRKPGEAAKQLPGVKVYRKGARYRMERVRIAPRPSPHRHFMTDAEGVPVV